MNAKEKVELYNQIQADWMALDYNAPDNVKRGVFNRMKTIPRSYLAVDPNRQFNKWSVIFNGMPVTAGTVREDAIMVANKNNIQIDIIWACGKWIENKGEE